MKNKPNNLSEEPNVESNAESNVELNAKEKERIFTKFMDDFGITQNELTTFATNPNIKKPNGYKQKTMNL